MAENDFNNLVKNIDVNMLELSKKYRFEGTLPSVGCKFLSCVDVSGDIEVPQMSSVSDITQSMSNLLRLIEPEEECLSEILNKIVGESDSDDTIDLCEIGIIEQTFEDIKRIPFIIPEIADEIVHVLESFPILPEEPSKNLFHIEFTEPEVDNRHPIKILSDQYFVKGYKKKTGGKKKKLFEFYDSENIDGKEEHNHTYELRKSKDCFEYIEISGHKKLIKKYVINSELLQ